MERSRLIGKVAMKDGERYSRLLSASSKTKASRQLRALDGVF